MLTARLELTLQFAAAHRVDSPRAGCPGLHGHNFGLAVVLAGPIDAATGTVADVPRAQKLLHELVYVPLDHGLLNDRIENPTLERVAEYIFGLLAVELPELDHVALDDGAGRTAVIRR